MWRSPPAATAVGGSCCASAVPTPSSPLVGVNHVVLEVDGVGEALSFYGRIFELEFRGRMSGMAFLDMGNQFLVLAEGRTQPPDGSRPFGLVVDDRDEVRRRLEESATEILPGRGPGLSAAGPGPLQLGTRHPHNALYFGC